MLLFAESLHDEGDKQHISSWVFVLGGRTHFFRVSKSS